MSTEARLDVAIKAAQDSPGFIASNLVAMFVAGEREHHRREFSAWLDAHAEPFILEWVTAKVRASRTRSISGRSAAFRHAADALEAGDDTPVRALLSQTFVVDAENTRRPLADLTVVELRFAADSYSHQSCALLMRAAFLRRVAVEVEARGGRVVGDVFGEAEIESLTL